MKKTILTLVCCAMVLLVGCTHDAINMNDQSEIIIYNQCADYVVSGARLVDPVLVMENEFCEEYDINIHDILANSDSEVQFRLEYTLDQNTNQADLSKLSNGVITVSKSGSVVFVMYISEIKPVETYVINSNKIDKSSIGNIDAELFNLSKETNSLLYGKFKCENYFITCSMYNSTEDEMTTLLRNFISNNSSDE